VGSDIPLRLFSLLNFSLIHYFKIIKINIIQKKLFIKMKKTLYLFLIGLLLISCDGNFSYPEELTTKQVFNLEVKSNEWVEYSDTAGYRYYSHYIEINEITHNIFTNGAVIAYFDADNRQQVLPYVRHYGKVGGYLWTRTIDYDVTEDGVTFYVTNSDFEADPPETMNFKVVLLW